jgi:hypothetical protein
MPELNASENPLETHDLRTIYSGAKHRIAILEQELEILKNAGAKRKLCGSSQWCYFFESQADTTLGQ